MNTISQLGRVAAQRMNKVADEGQPTDAPLGSLQHAYVADAIGAEASARAAAQTKDHPDVEDSMINEMIASGAGQEEPLQRRIRHGASRLSETAGGRMVGAFDPTSWLTDNPDATLTNLIMGAGKKNPEREELVKQRYADVLKPHQDKLDPDAELTDRDTPWHRMQQGDLANLDSDIAGHKYMRSEKPFQYWLNPFDKSGPLSELGDRASRRINAGMAYPDSTAGRFGMGLGTVGSLGLLPLLTGGEKAQQSLRGSAAKNKIYADVADPERKGEKKDKDKDTEKDAAIAEFFFKSAGKPVNHPAAALTDPSLPFNEATNPLNPKRYKGKNYAPYPAYRGEPPRGNVPLAGKPPAPAPAPTLPSAPVATPAPTTPAPSIPRQQTDTAMTMPEPISAPDNLAQQPPQQPSTDLWGAMREMGENPDTRPFQNLQNLTDHSTGEVTISPHQDASPPPEYGAEMPINDPSGQGQGDFSPDTASAASPSDNIPTRESEWDRINRNEGFEFNPQGTGRSLGVGKATEMQRKRWRARQMDAYAKQFPDAVTMDGNKRTIAAPERNQRMAEQMQNSNILQPVDPGQ